MTATGGDASADASVGGSVGAAGSEVGHWGGGGEDGGRYLPRAGRADRRLYPRRWSSRFAAATLVRRGIEAAVARHLPGMAPVTVVDLGCGGMPYRPVLAGYTREYVGVDLPGNELARYVVGADGRSDCPDAVGDVALSTQALEHVPDPGAYLAEARRVIRTGGLLMLTTHGLWPYHADPTDFHRWTGPGLARLVEGTGFEVVELTGMMGLLPASLQLASDAVVRQVFPRWLRRAAGPAFALVTQTPLLWSDALHTPEQRAKDAAAFLVVGRKV